MTREQKLEVIYAEMANKKLKLWCKCKNHNWENVIFIRQNKTWSYLSIRENEEFTVSLWYAPEIIWHPVMIGDVIEWIEPYWGWYAQDLRFSQERKRKINIVLLQWDKKRESIDTQSDECIDYVYSLIPSISME